MGFGGAQAPLIFWIGKPGKKMDMLVPGPQRRTAGCDDGGRRDGSRNPVNGGGGHGADMLAIVHDQQRPALSEHRDHATQRVFQAERHTDRRGKRRHDEAGIVDCRQIHKGDAAGKLAAHPLRNRDGKRCLAHAARPCNGHVAGVDQLLRNDAGDLFAAIKLRHIRRSGRLRPIVSKRIPPVVAFHPGNELVSTPGNGCDIGCIAVAVGQLSPQ